MVAEISISSQHFPKTSFTPPKGCPAQAKIVVIGNYPSTAEQSTSMEWMQTYYSGPFDHSVLSIDARPIKQTILERKTAESRAERIIGAQNMAKIEHFDNLLVASPNARLRLALGAEQFPYENHHIMLHNTRTSSNLWNAPFQLAIDDSSIFLPLYHPQQFDHSRLTSAIIVRGMQAVIRLAHDLVDYPSPPLALATAVDIVREQSGWNVVGSFLSEELGERSSTSHRPKTLFNLGAWQRTGSNLYLLLKKMK
ncbi:hypothetical protein CKM354_000979300 [Cercospora kikuchii]|uniref:Uncharacterized protein n=1 Tax=Cercospora kikuchii TaxID=84275 RepID=A0A9P3CVU7_9PEZI|nr:uncharacterized protein CKM354_000979300 [Cercospora kikuchii]GIZ46675.1 hypothetical protein CKM354_000979300 [Cercospora kikuchii]